MIKFRISFFTYMNFCLRHDVNVCNPFLNDRIYCKKMEHNIYYALICNNNLPFSDLNSAMVFLNLIS